MDPLSSAYKFKVSSFNFSLTVSESPLRVPGICCDKLTELFGTLQTAGFECFITKLSSIYEQFTYKAFDCENVSNSLLPNDNDEKLSSLFRDVKSNTSKIEMLSRLRFVNIHSCL